MNFVIDNSVSMRWLFEDGSRSDLAYADKVLAALGSQTAVAPVTWSLEAANVIARAEARKDITIADAAAFLNMLVGLGILTDTSTHIHALSDTLTLARTYKISAYDASYLELAKRLGIPLASLDEDLQKACRKTKVEIF